MSVRRVRKRDGREVPFDKDKIRLAVLAAQTAVGEVDPSFAREVADLVELALRRRFAWTGPRALGSTAGIFREEGDPDLDEATATEAIPDLELIQDLVEIGLIELGHAAVAKAYILYRDRRTRARESLPETGRGAERASGSLRSLRVREAEGTFPWSKSRIVAALVHEAELSRSQAEEVAAKVELRVVSSGLKRISTALIRELVDNELVAMGLASALARHAPVAVPRYDLRQLLRIGPRALSPERPAAIADRLAENGVGGALGGELLRRFVLSDVFEERFAERHFSGDFHLEDVRAPHLHLWQALPAELLLRGQPGARAAFDLLGEIASLCGSVSRGIVLEAPGALLGPLIRSNRGDGGGPLGAWVAALSALARGSGRRIDLASPGLRSPALCARLVAEIAEFFCSGEREGLPRLFLDASELHSVCSGPPELRRQAELLLADGLLLPTWSRPDERFAGPACRRLGREQGALACGGAVALNLARLARHAGPWREDLALASLAHLVEEAVEALAQLSRFQREESAARSGEARGRVAYALSPVGLAEALRSLGDGEVRPEQGARLLGLISDAARRFSAERGLSVTMTPFFGEEAAIRFARLDAGGAQARQHLLFESTAPVAGASRALSEGYRLGPRPFHEPGAAQAVLLATVPVGPWLPLELDHGSRSLEATPQLDAWQRFDAERSALRSPASLRTAGGVSAAPLFSLPASPPRSPRAS